MVYIETNREIKSVKYLPQIIIVTIIDFHSRLTVIYKMVMSQVEKYLYSLKNS